MLSHYLVCPVLWQLARQLLNLPELSLSVEHRHGICEPTVDKIRMLAFCHSLYHACVNDTECMRSDSLQCTGQVAQLRACELARHCIHLVGGGQYMYHLPALLLVFTLLVEVSTTFPRSFSFRM